MFTMVLLAGFVLLGNCRGLQHHSTDRQRGQAKCFTKQRPKSCWPFETKTTVAMDELHPDLFHVRHPNYKEGEERCSLKGAAAERRVCFSKTRKGVSVPARGSEIEPAGLGSLLPWYLIGAWCGDSARRVLRFLIAPRRLV